MHHSLSLCVDFEMIRYVYNYVNMNINIYRSYYIISNRSYYFSLVFATVLVRFSHPSAPLSNSGSFILDALDPVSKNTARIRSMSKKTSSA